MKARVPSLLPGFFLSGFLLAFLGAALPGWNYHYTEQHALAGWLFFALSIGMFVAGQLWQRGFPRLPTRMLCLMASGLAIPALLLPGTLPTPVRFEVQMTASFLLGLSAGFLHVALFQSIRQAYRADAAGTIMRAGIYFGAGCFTAAALGATAFRLGSVSQTPAALALVPACFFLFFLRLPRLDIDVSPLPDTSLSLKEFSKAGAILFGLLLLFQSGSEWTVAGWLPLFLTHRIGLSPEDALWMLAIFWFALSAARIIMVFLLARVSHSRMLFSGAACARAGCFLLISTNNYQGAFAAVLLLGVGFAAVYPLLAEKIGKRFPDYHPATFNSIFSLALSGGLLSPWLAGIFAQIWGLSIVMVLPAVGTFLVVALLLVLWLESKVTGR